MAIATSMAIGLGVAAAAQGGAAIYSAKQGSKAAKQAAKTQTEHADRGMAAVDYALGPWVNKGRETASTLGRLTAAPSGSRFAAPDPTMPRNPGNVGYQPPTQGQRPNPQQGGTLGGLARRKQGPQQQGPGGPGMGGPQGPPMPGGGGPQMIPMRAPDGSVQPVPSHLVQQFMSKGAQLAE